MTIDPIDLLQSSLQKLISSLLSDSSSFNVFISFTLYLFILLLNLYVIERYPCSVFTNCEFCMLSTDLNTNSMTEDSDIE